MRKKDGEFNVIGLSLPVDCLKALRTAFPHFIQRQPQTEDCEQISTLCSFLGNVVIFLYMPAMLPHMFLRTSAIFERDKVFVVGIHPACCDEVYDTAFDCEFDGVLESDADAERYTRVAAAVRNKELWFPRPYLSQRTRKFASDSFPQALSSREADILRLLAAGQSNQAIADALYISRDTVRWHLRSMYTKLGVSDRRAAICVAKNNMPGIDDSISLPDAPPKSRARSAVSVSEL